MDEALGVRFYIGEPDTGKTYLMLADAKRSKLPFIFVDSRGDGKNPRYLPPLVGGPFEAIDRAFGAGKAARFIPKSEAQVDCLFAAAEKVRVPCCIGIDELVFWTTASYCPEHLLYCCRTYGHLGPLSVLATTQAPQDVPSKIRQCPTDVFLFRSTDARAREALRQWSGEADLAALPNRKFLHWRPTGNG